MSLRENYLRFLLDTDKTLLEGEEKIFKALKKQEDLTDIIWKYLEKVYSSLISFVKENYPTIKANGIDILSLLWSGDEKTVSDRVEAALAKVNPFPHLCLILENEAYQITNNYLNNIVSKEAKYFEVISNAKCCEYCNELYLPGIHPIAELNERAPFHVDCRCLTIFYIDKPEEEN